ncbi:MAG TPA: polysaccharide deacetylase family protein [Bacteroidota bacterium]
MDRTRKVIYLVFTGHEFADGGQVIRDVLRKNNIKASFFFTGDFYRTKSFSSLIEGLKADGHYLGPHSDKHLLYASWTNRDSTLVDKSEFLSDLHANIEAIVGFGILPQNIKFFLPAFEWYNRQISDWTTTSGMQLVNFTPGTSSNADYTTPEMGSRYVSSDTIVERILSYEQSHADGLNGFLLLSHIGTALERTDKFYNRLGDLLAELEKRGYTFRRLE